MQTKTRLMKAQCSHGYTVRVTGKWAAEGLPRCPEGHKLHLIVSDPSTADTLYVFDHNLKQQTRKVSGIFRGVK